MSNASIPLTPGHPMLKGEKYTLAWRLLLHTRGVDAYDQAQAKCWLTYRAIDGEITLEDWVTKISPVAPVQAAEWARVRWGISQSAAETYLWLLRGDQPELGWDAAARAEAMGDDLTHHTPSVQAWLMVALLLAFREWTRGNDAEARMKIRAAVEKWRTAMQATDWTVHPLRWAEAHADLDVLSAFMFFAEKLGLTAIPKVPEVPVPWITVETVLNSRAHQPWVKCLRLLQTPACRLEPEHKYQDDYRKIHADNPKYGSGPGVHDMGVIGLLTMGISVKRAVDFGCGHSTALKQLWPQAEHARYDFAIPGLDTLPSGRFDLGISTDVLEHVPEAELDTALRRMAAWSDRWVFLIHTGPAKQMLPSNGGNAHVTQRNHAWWMSRVRLFFPNLTAWQPLDPKRCGLVTWVAVRLPV